jgi:hypothetical protein
LFDHRPRRVSALGRQEEHLYAQDQNGYCDYADEGQHNLPKGEHQALFSITLVSSFHL